MAIAQFQDLAQTLPGNTIIWFQPWVANAPAGYAAFADPGKPSVTLDAESEIGEPEIDGIVDLMYEDPDQGTVNQKLLKNAKIKFQLPVVEGGAMAVQRLIHADAGNGDITVGHCIGQVKIEALFRWEIGGTFQHLYFPEAYFEYKAPKLGHSGQKNQQLTLIAMYHKTSGVFYELKQTAPA